MLLLRLTWVWSGGPERNQIFYTHDGVNNDGFTNWRTGEPNNCCIDTLGTYIMEILWKQTNIFQLLVVNIILSLVM